MEWFFLDLGVSFLNRGRVFLAFSFLLFLLFVFFVPLVLDSLVSFCLTFLIKCFERLVCIAISISVLLCVCTFVAIKSSIWRSSSVLVNSLAKLHASFILETAVAISLSSLELAFSASLHPLPAATVAATGKKKLKERKKWTWDLDYPKPKNIYVVTQVKILRIAVLTTSTLQQPEL